MALYLIIDAFRKLGSPSVKNDDFYDRLSRRYSEILLGVSFLIVSSSQFIGNPINCYTFNIPGSHVNYVNWVCWINSSYYIPFDKPLSRNEPRPSKISYYQWVPFILLCMMFLFYLPGFVWRNLNKTCSINTKAILKMVTDLDQLDGEKREKSIRTLAKHIDKALAYHREYEYGLVYNMRRRLRYLFCLGMGRHSGNFLAWTYVFIKLLYTVNAVGQIFLMNAFMKDKYSYFGYEALKHWMFGNTSAITERFPTVTICPFSLRTLGDNIHSHEVQCLLPINIYNEKIFIFIWFWLVFVAVASLYGLIKWLYYFTPDARQNFIQRFLKANEIRYYKSSTPSSLSTTGIGANSDHDDQLPIKNLEDFVDNYCRQDGLLLLRIIKINTNSVIAGEVICALWDNWKVLPQIRYNPSLGSDNCGEIIGLGMKSALKQRDVGDVNEKLLPPM